MGVWIRGCPMATFLLASVHFLLLLPCSRGLPNYVVLSRRKMTSRRKKSVADSIYMSWASHCMCCVLEQDTFILVLVLVQPRKTRPDISEKLLTGR